MDDILNYINLKCNTVITFTLLMNVSRCDGIFYVLKCADSSLKMVHTITLVEQKIFSVNIVTV